MWNERYESDEFFYGTEANQFLQSQAHRLAPNSRVLCIAEGEGRNALYLAGLGHRVTAMDQASVGLAKGEKRAIELGLEIEWVCADLEHFDFGQNQWDAIVGIFAHLPPTLRHKVFAQIPTALSGGGLWICEYYHPDQINYGTGGPKDPTWMLTTELLRSELPTLDPLHQAEIERDVIEGKGHTGLAKVCQWIAQK